MPWRSPRSSLRRPRPTRSTPRRRPTRGSATSSTARRRARTRRSTSGRSPAGTPAQSRPASEGGRARRRSTPSRARSSSAPRRSAPTGTRSAPFGDAVFRIQYHGRRTPQTATPQRRHHGPHAGGPLHRAPTRPPSWPRSRPASTTTSARARCWSATAHARRDSTTYSWAGASGPVPAGVERLGPAVRRTRAPTARAAGATNLTNLAGTGPLTHQQQRRQPPALDAGRLRPRGADQRDADRHRPARRLRSDQDRLDLQLPQPQRPAVAHLRAAGQGRLARDGDPHHRPAVHGAGRRPHDQPVRQLDPEDRLAQRRSARPSRASSRAATWACRPTAATTASPTARSRSRSSRPADIPVNTVAPTVTGTGFVGQNLTCNHGHLDRAGGHHVLPQVVPVQQDRADATRTSAPRARSTSAASAPRPIPTVSTATRT